MSHTLEPAKVPAKATARLRPLTEVIDIRRAWVELEKESTCTFFQSWHWMGPWLEYFADRQNTYVFECYRGESLIGLGVLGSGRIRRRLFFTSNQLVLNESADSTRNMLIEHNGLLSRRGETNAVIAEFFRVISALHEWEELRINFGEQGFWLNHAKFQAGIEPVVDWVSPTWVVPLTRHTTIETLVAGFSRNRRCQIRRTFKEFEKRGPVSIKAAESLAEAMRYFHSLRELHTRRWRMKGKDGSFSHEGWSRFHEMLIRAGLAAGVVQLLRVRCGEEDVGYIYNLIWRGNVLMLQTGFMRTTNNRLRSGYISHLLAMQFNAQRGMCSYDFLPGNDEYKKIFAKPGPEIASFRLQRRSAKFQAEHVLVRAVRMIRRWGELMRSRRSSIDSFVCFSMLSLGRALAVVDEVEFFSPGFSL